jgi:AAHS family 4-hydroxybenzoate transporter-like MFS transporter
MRTDETEAKRRMPVTFLAFLIIMVDGYDTLMVSFIAPVLQKQWALPPAAIGRIFAMGYLGAIIGAVGIGPLADRFGRRPLLALALIVASLSTMACAAAGSLETLVWLRLLAGAALGGALPCLMAITAEHARAERRTGTVTLMYIGYPLGAVVGGAATASLLHHGWPAIFLSTGLLCLVAAGIALLLPESLRRSAVVQAERRPASALFFEQFAEGRLWPALTLWLGVFSLLLLTYFLLSWTPSLIVARGGSPKVAALGGVLLNLGGIAGALVMAPLVNRFGPYRPIAAVVAAGAVVVSFVGLDFGSLAPMFVLLFLAGFCIMGGQLNFPAMTVDLFPPHVRGAGAGWTIGVGRVGSIVGPILGAMLMTAGLASRSLFLIAALPALLCAVSLTLAALLRGRARGTCSVPAAAQNL